MKALVGAFNQEKALVGAFSVITNLRMDLRFKLYVLHLYWPPDQMGPIKYLDIGTSAATAARNQIFFHKSIFICVE